MTTMPDDEDAEVSKLLGQAQEVMELGFSIEVIEKEEKAGRWPDLTRLEARRPDILAGIVWFLARGVAVKSICKALTVSPCTVNRVRHDPRWKEAVVSQSKGLAAKIDEILSLKVDEVLEDALKGKLPSIFDAKLLVEIKLAITGGAPLRVEIVAGEEEKEFLRFFQLARQQHALPGPERVREVEILPQLGALDVEVERGFDGGQSNT